MRQPDLDEVIARLMNQGAGAAEIVARLRAVGLLTDSPLDREMVEDAAALVAEHRAERAATPPEPRTGTPSQLDRLYSVLRHPALVALLPGGAPLGWVALLLRSGANQVVGGEDCDAAIEAARAVLAARQGGAQIPTPVISHTTAVALWYLMADPRFEGLYRDQEGTVRVEAHPSAPNFPVVGPDLDQAIWAAAIHLHPTLD